MVKEREVGRKKRMANSKEVRSRKYKVGRGKKEASSRQRIAGSKHQRGRKLEAGGTKPYIIIFFLALGLDILTKRLFMHKSFAVLQGILSITYAENTGIAWSMLPNQNFTIIWVYVIALGILIAGHEYFNGGAVSKAAYALIFAGVLGNFIDRVAYGFVVDFIDFHFWPIFNIADAAITAGIILVFYYEIFQNTRGS